MTSKSKDLIKAFFETGDRPSESQFIDLIDSYVDRSGPIGTIEALASAGSQGFAFTSAGSGKINNAANARTFLGMTVYTTAQVSAVAADSVRNTYTTTAQSSAIASEAVSALTYSRNVWDKQQSGDVKTLNDASSITPNFALGNNFEVTLGGNRTLENPTGQRKGQSGLITISKDANDRTLAYGTEWLFPGGVDPVLSSSSAVFDILYYYVKATGEVAANLNKGFA